MERTAVETPRNSSDSDHGDDDSITTTTSLSPNNPLSPDPESAPHGPKLTFGDAVALLIGLQIGSGVFSSPSQVSKHTPGPGFALVIWLSAGLLAWTGAACYAELGTALPVSGGTQEYLKHMYGEDLAFLASWIWILGVKASGMATLTIVATQYWINFLFGSSVPNDGWECKTIALAIYSVIVSINMLGINVTRAVNKAMSIVKLLTLTLLFLLSILAITTGLHLGDEPLGQDWRQKNWFSTTNPTWTTGIWAGVGECTLALYAGLWAFSGWDNINIVAGDLQNPNRDLPRAMHTSQPVVIVSFILANICYYSIIPWSEVDSDDAIALTVGETVLGRTGSLTFVVLVSTACLGTVSVNVFTSSRLVISAARAGWLPRALEKSSTAPLDRLYQIRRRHHHHHDHHHDSAESPTHATPHQTPIRAMLFTTCLVSIYIATGTFASLITFIGLAEYTFFTSATVGLLIMRTVKEPPLTLPLPHPHPHLHPYQTPLLVPITFSSVGILIVLVGTVKAPAQAALLCGLLMVGVVRKWNFTRGGDGGWPSSSSLCERVSRVWTGNNNNNHHRHRHRHRHHQQTDADDGRGIYENVESNQQPPSH